MSASVTDAVAFLRTHGEELLAIVVESLQDSERRCRRAAEENLRMYYELKDKHEPRRKGESYVNWTGD